MNAPTWVIPVVLVVVGLFIVAAVIGLIVAGVKESRRKQAAFADGVASMGLSLQLKGDKEFAKAWSIVKPLTKGGTVTNIVFGTLNSGLTLTAFKHVYVVSTGKSTHVVQNAVIAVDTPEWPKVEITRRNAVAKWVRGLFGKDKPDPAAPPPGLEESEKAEFERNWIVNADDAAFAEALLTPEVRAELESDEKVAAWWFVGGKMLSLRATSPTLDLLTDGIAQIERVWAAIPQGITSSTASPPADPDVESTT